MLIMPSPFLCQKQCKFFDISQGCITEFAYSQVNPNGRYMIRGTNPVFKYITMKQSRKGLGEEELLGNKKK